jgi:hypothetical protein
MHIYVLLPPTNQNNYARGHRTSWDQITHFVYSDILKKFPKNTTYLNWHSDAPMKREDVLITARPCYPPQCNSQMQKFPERTIIVDNDNFDVNKWKHGRFNKYNLNTETVHTYPLNNLMENLYGAIYKTNDVAIRKWNSNDPDVLETKQFILSKVKHVEILPHPIDKDHFSKLYNPSLKLSNLKMLVYHLDISKNATQLIDMLGKNFPSTSYSVINSINKTEDRVRGIV